MMMEKRYKHTAMVKMVYPLRHVSPKLFAIRKSLVLYILGGSGHILMGSALKYLITPA